MPSKIFVLKDGTRWIYFQGTYYHYDKENNLIDKATKKPFTSKKLLKTITRHGLLERM